MAYEMKNANEPAYPVEVSYRNGKIQGPQTGETTGFAIGLTKRELFAKDMAAALLTNPGLGNAVGPGTIQENDIILSRTAIRIADELLKQLEL